MDLMCLSFDEYREFYRPRFSYLGEYHRLKLVKTNYSNDRIYNLKCRIHEDLFNPDYDVKEHIDRLKSLINENKANGFLLYYDEDIIGTADVCIINEFIYISNLGISSVYRGKGFGKILLFLILEEVIGIYKNKFDCIYLTVDEDNRHAKYLYSSMGFEVEN